MQIICNHCGNQLSFPDYQNLVTCNHCNTHLQIEETETTYSASIIQKELFDDLLVQQSVTNYREFSYSLVDFLNLETKFSKMIQLTSFFSFLSRSKVEPSLFRALYRFVIAFIAIKEIEGSRDYFVNIYESFFLWLIIYACIIILLGIAELVKWFMLKLFREIYIRKSRKIEATIETDLLLNNLILDTNWYQQWKDNEATFQEVKKKLSFINLGFQLPTSLPSVSKGFRIFVMAVPTFLWTFKGSFVDDFILFPFIFLILTISISWIGLKLMLNGDEYKNEYQAYHIKRKKLLDALKEFIEK